MRLLFVTTGGTIDKIYFDAKSTFAVGETELGHKLDELEVMFAYRIIPLLRKDSLELSDADRELIAATVDGQPEDRVIVTHGTDTMTRTAEVLKRVAGKTIVLTGALRPSRFSNSDALFNIGAATAAVQVLDPGVYIAMGGRVLRPEHIRKNISTNRFEEVLEHAQE